MREPAREPTPGPEPVERREERYEYRPTARPASEFEFHPDMVRWSAVFGGTVAAISILLVLTVLGSWVGLGTTATTSTTWGIWSAISMIIALYFGAWLAARTSATVGSFSGVIDGSLVWATTLVITLFLTGFGVAALLGPLIGNFATFGAPSPTIPGAPPANLATVAMWAFIGLVVSYIAAVLGGLFGASQEEHIYRKRF